MSNGSFMELEASSIWWDQVGSSLVLLRRLRRCFGSDRSVVLHTGGRLPWRQTFAQRLRLEAGRYGDGRSLNAHPAGECADPDECKMIADLGVDMLAAGIGNIHGKYPENWAGLSFETLAAIKEKVGDMPLVLHGGTGIPDEMVHKAISLGVAKVNVNTECQLVFAEATRKYIEAGKDLSGKGFDPRKLLADGATAIVEKVKEKMELFGSVGKA